MMTRSAAARASLAPRASMAPMRSYQYRDNGDSVSCTLLVVTPRGVQPVRRATVSKRAVAAMLAGRGAPVELAGLWSRIKKGAKKTVRGVTRATAKVARAAVDKVVKPVAKVWLKVEEKIRPIAKQIPIVGGFARLHEKWVRPHTEKLFGEKERAKKIAKVGTPAQKAEARVRLVRAAANVAKAQQAVVKATATMARTEPKVLARKKKAARARANVYQVITPSGKRFSIPATALR